MSRLLLLFTLAILAAGCAASSGAPREKGAASAAEPAWTRTDVGRDVLLLGVAFVSDEVVVAVGGDHEDEPGAIFRSEDRGRTWTEVRHDARHRLYDVTFVDERVGHACGLGGTLLRTEDGGRSWRLLDCGTKGWLASVAFTTPEIGFLAGGDEDRPLMLATADGGASWARRELPPLQVPSRSFRKIRFRDGGVGVAVGTAGLIAETKDGGATWSARSDFAVGWLRDVDFDGAGVAVAIAADGAIVRLDDRHGFIRLPVEIRDKVNAIVIDPDHGPLVTTMAGGLATLGRDGLSWRTILQPTPGAALTDLERAPDGRLIAVGDDGSVLLLARIEIPAEAGVEPPRAHDEGD